MSLDPLSSQHAPSAEGEHINCAGIDVCNIKYSRRPFSCMNKHAMTRYAVGSTASICRDVRVCDASRHARAVLKAKISPGAKHSISNTIIHRSRLVGNRAINRTAAGPLLGSRYHVTYRTCSRRGIVLRTTETTGDLADSDLLARPTTPRAVCRLGRWSSGADAMRATKQDAGPKRQP